MGQKRLRLAEASGNLAISPPVTASTRGEESRLRPQPSRACYRIKFPQFLSALRMIFVHSFL